MEAIERLEHHYIMLIMTGTTQPCIEWAIERLELNQEEDDLDVVLLAAATQKDEGVLPLVVKILEKYSQLAILDHQVVAGKYIVTLRQRYLAGFETITSLDPKFWKTFAHLGGPGWLVMLCRNCEYATDIQCFEQPFEQEFEYIAGLWASCSTQAEFNSRYSRAASDQHDAEFLKRAVVITKDTSLPQRLGIRLKAILRRVSLNHWCRPGKDTR